MASLSRDGAGRFTVQVRGKDGKRRSVRLGVVNKKIAAEIHRRIESLHTAAITGTNWDSELATWVAGIGDEFADKLHRAGLIPARVKSESLTLRTFLDRFLESRHGDAANTIRNHEQAANILCRYVGAGKLLSQITPAAAERAVAEIRKKYAQAHAARLIKFFRQFFRNADGPNPFAGIKPGPMTNQSLIRFVTRAEIDRVIDACPDGRWRLIVSLCRYGGLRCPSELRTLTWSDVDWDRNRFLVRSSKTKQNRWIPIFPEILPHFESEFDRSQPGTVRVVDVDNLRTEFERILKRAGLNAWPRLFQNMRASRETELMREFPIHVVTAWIGNSVTIAARHYLSVTEEDYARAGGAKSGASAVQNPVSHLLTRNHTESHETKK